jgi:hypothetical protein
MDHWEDDVTSTKPADTAKVQVDLEKCLRVSKKVLDLLQKRTKSSAEAYFAVRLVGIFLEEKLGFKITPIQEDEFRKLWRKDAEAPGNASKPEAHKQTKRPE